jgi:hypothetical protein
MRLLDFIFGKPTKLENEFFGVMLFQKNKKVPLESYFECRRLFIPSKKIIEIIINGDLSGPTQKQINFFKSIENNYATIIASIIPLIENEFRNWQEDFKITNFQKEFEPVCLNIPNCENEPITWEIAFESEHDLNHTFTLTMRNLEAIDILIDG